MFIQFVIEALSQTGTPKYLYATQSCWGPAHLLTKDLMEAMVFTDYSEAARFIAQEQKHWEVTILRIRSIESTAKRKLCAWPKLT